MLHTLINQNSLVIIFNKARIIYFIVIYYQIISMTESKTKCYKYTCTLVHLTTIR